MRNATYTFLGANNVDDPADVGAPLDSRELVFTEVVKLVNVDPDNRGGAALRPGREQASVATGLHSGWSDPHTPDIGYFVNGTFLNRVDAAGALTIVKYDLIPGRHVTFCQINDALVYSNGLQFGVIENGADTPPFTPTAPFKVRMVAGSAMEFYNGRLYTLVDNYDGTPGCALICSDSLDTPGGIESMDTRQNIVGVFRGAGKMVCRVESKDGGGLFVSAGDETFWLAGRDAVLEGGFAAQESVAPYAAIPGTARAIKGELLKGNLSGNACIWASTRGVCVGAAGGVFLNVSEKKVSYPDGQVGTAVVREENGLVHYVFVLQGAGTAYNTFAGSP